MSIQFLNWDSEFFQKKIGLIHYDSSTNLEIEVVLHNAKLEGYQLVYVFTDKDKNLETNLLENFNGKLVDTKITYTKYLTLNNKELDSVNIYNSTILSPELEELAYLSGEHSRFLTDKCFQPDDFYKMYKIWIQNSINKKIADSVYITQDNGITTGMATLKINADIGEIGLIAIAKSGQGKGLGKQLIYAIENYLLSKNIHTLDVPTQMANKQACVFYEKCGFSIKSIVNIYHFWL